jgi:hydroxyacylglutathione hydrolase
VDERLFVKRLEAGVDFGVRDRVAHQMGNLVYVIGDRVARECVLVDPAWDVPGLLAQVDALGCALVGALVTHWHPDHVGGDLMGHPVEGLAALQTLRPVPVYLHAGDLELTMAMTGLSRTDFRTVSGGDTVKVGEVEVECLHTPGHTEGSQCFRCGKHLVSGDTLFLSGCGRTDLPGGDPDEMMRTITQRLLTLPKDLILHPGHHYGAGPRNPVELSMGDVAEVNPVLVAARRRVGIA